MCLLMLHYYIGAAGELITKEEDPCGRFGWREYWTKWSFRESMFIYLINQSE